MRYNYKTWPMEYGGALQSIRLNYIVPAFIAVIIIFLIMSYFSIFNEKTSKLTQRLPISPKIQLLTQIAHSLIILLSFWLIQFLIIIAGFLIYRYSAPDGLMINLQIFKIFWYPGLVAGLYPFLNLDYFTKWLGILACLSVLPSFIAYRDKAMKGNFLWMVIKIIFFIFALFMIRSSLPEELKKIMDSACTILFVGVMVGVLIYKIILLEKENR